jgi:hypothetical protein
MIGRAKAITKNIYAKRRKIVRLFFDNLLSFSFIFSKTSEEKTTSRFLFLFFMINQNGTIATSSHKYSIF